MEARILSYFISTGPISLRIEDRLKITCLYDITARPEMELLPEPIQPSPIPQQAGQSTTKKKKTRHMVRPGYARQPDSKG